MKAFDNAKLYSITFHDIFFDYPGGRDSHKVIRTATVHPVNPAREEDFNQPCVGRCDTFTCPTNFFYCELCTCNLFLLSSENCIFKSKYRVSRRGTCWDWTKSTPGTNSICAYKCVKIIKRVFVLETLLAFLSDHYAVPLIAESSSSQCQLGKWFSAHRR